MVESSAPPLRLVLFLRLKGALCSFWGGYFNWKRERALWLNKQKGLDNTISEFAYVADPATFSSAKLFWRPRFPPRTACLLSYGKKPPHPFLSLCYYLIDKCSNSEFLQSAPLSSSLFNNRPDYITQKETEP